MANAYKDENDVSTLIAVSTADGQTPVRLWADPVTHRLLVDIPGTTGTVTSVSVVTANGFAGSVANPTSTPAITLTTTITGILSGNGTAISAASTTGSGAVVLATSPTLVTPALGTPSALVGTNITGTAAGLTAGTVTTNANLTGPVTSTGNATAIANDINLPGNPTTTTQSPGDNSTKIATTAFVANAVLGQDYKEACKYATTAALPTVVYANGSSGVGATLTAVALGALSLDGSTPSVADRVLVKNQVSTFQNGIYVVTAVGSVGAVFIMTRATDFDQSGDIVTGASTFITSGSTQATTTWAYTGIDAPTIGTSAITFVQTAGQGSFVAGNGISITGTTIAIDTAVTVDKTTAQTLTNKTLTAPVMTAPVLGTPASGVATNLTGTASGLTAGNVTTNANLTGPITSSGNATAIASQTGTGTKFVVDTSPTLITPVLGVASATSLATSAASPLLLTNGQLATIALTSQTVGGATLTIPDFASVSDEFTFKTKAQTMSNKTFVAPALGTPASGVATNLTGTATGLTVGSSNAIQSATTTVNTSSATAPTTGQVLTATGASAATWQTPSGGQPLYNCSVYQSGTTTATNSWAACAFAAENFDTDTMHDTVTNNSRITFTHAGKYLVGGTVYINGNQSSGARIRLNGTTVLSLALVGNAGTPTAVGVTAFYVFSAGDYVELQAFAGSNTATSGDQQTNFWATLIST